MSTAELKIKELELDINEFKLILSQATRDIVKKSIESSLAASQSELDKLQKAEKLRIERLNSANTPVIGFIKKIDTYGWDQSEKFVKIYITSLKDISSVQENNVICNFQPKSFDLMIKNLNNVNYNLIVNNLLFKIDPDQSYVKCKKDMITVFLKKVETGKHWAGVLEKDLKVKEASMPKIDEKADPQEGLMSMMKKMYEEGDDEMKRTISKAFMESREKQSKGVDMAGFGDI